MVLSGGVVANVKLNQRLREIPGVDGIFVHPNMGDGGCGTGAALLEFVRQGAPRDRCDTTCISGPSYTDDEIVDALDARAAAVRPRTRRSSRRSRS